MLHHKRMQTCFDGRLPRHPWIHSTKHRVHRCACHPIHVSNNMQRSAGMFWHTSAETSRMTSESHVSSTQTCPRVDVVLDVSGDVCKDDYGDTWWDVWSNMFLNVIGNVVPFLRRYPGRPLGCPHSHAHLTRDIFIWVCQGMWTCTQNDVSPPPTWNCECHVGEVQSRTSYLKPHGYAS